MISNFSKITKLREVFDLVIQISTINLDKLFSNQNRLYNNTKNLNMKYLKNKKAILFLPEIKNFLNSCPYSNFEIYYYGRVTI